VGGSDGIDRSGSEDAYYGSPRAACALDRRMANRSLKQMMVLPIRGMAIWAYSIRSEPQRHSYHSMPTTTFLRGCFNTRCSTQRAQGTGSMVMESFQYHLPQIIITQSSAHSLPGPLVFHCSLLNVVAQTHTGFPIYAFWRWHGLFSKSPGYRIVSGRHHFHQGVS
jgi:hypothetical protein